MSTQQNDQPALYGTATIGTKGQIVIPAEAREAMQLAPGDKVVIFAAKKGMLCISPIDGIEKMLAQLTRHLATMRKVVEDHKNITK